MLCSWAQPDATALAGDLCVCISLCQMKQFLRRFLVKHSPCSQGRKTAHMAARALGPPKAYTFLPFSALPVSAGEPFQCVQPFLGTSAAPPSPEGNPSHWGRPHNSLVRQMSSVPTLPEGIWSENVLQLSLSICSYSITLTQLMVATFLPAFRKPSLLNTNLCYL